MNINQERPKIVPKEAVWNSSQNEWELGIKNKRGKHIVECGKLIKGFTFLILFVSSVYAQAQDKSSTKTSYFDPRTVSIDSAVSWLASARLEDDTSFIGISRSVSNLAKQKKDYYNLGRIYSYISNWYYLNGSMYSADSIIRNQEIGIAYYEKAKKFDDANEMYVGIAVDYLDNNEPNKAEAAVLKAIRYFEKTNNKPWLAEAQAQISALYEETEQPEKAIEYALKCYPTLLKNEEYLVGGATLLTASNAYLSLKDYTKSFGVINHCIQVCSNHDFNQNMDLLIAAYEMKGNIYLDQKNYDEAIVYYDKAWQENIALGAESEEYFRYIMGNALLKQGKYKEALPHLIAEVNGGPNTESETKPEIYLALSTCYEKLGNYKKALEYKDSAMNTTNKKYEDRINFLHSEAIIKYETGKKDEALAAQEQLLSQKNKVQQLIIGIAGLLVVLLIFLLFFLLKNRKATRVIRQKNDENELLLKEIHHRVKNNLEMVKSLISLQSAQLEDSATKDAMIASQNRVQSMGIIHQKLYQGNNLGAIEMKDYFINLGDGILDAFAKTDQVKIECAMNDLDLDVDTAVPIGLIVNELLTNALKYAFPKDETGTIKIDLSKMDNDILSLKFSDNGIGKNGANARKGTGFGTQLIQLLTQQLNGKMQESDEIGTSYVFQFKLNTAA